MQAWLKYDEYDEWFKEKVSPHGIRGFDKDMPITIVGHVHADDGEEMVLVEQNHLTLPIAIAACYIPVRFISLEPIAPDVY